MLLVESPTILRVVPGGFQFVDHEGAVFLELGTRELWAVTSLLRPTSLEDAYDDHVARSAAVAGQREIASAAIANHTDAIGWAADDTLFIPQLCAPRRMSSAASTIGIPTTSAGP